MKKFNLLHDYENGEIFLDGVSYVMYDRKIGRTAHQLYYEKIIGPTTKTILHNAAKKFSRKVFYKQYERYDEFRDERVVLKILELFSKLGYGVPYMICYDDKNLKFKIAIKNCYNAGDFKNFNKPFCYEMSGILAGLFEVVFGKEMICSEIKCRTMNWKYCEFGIKSTGRDIEPCEEYENKNEGISERKIREVDILFDEENGEIFSYGISSFLYPREEVATIEREFRRIVGPVIGTIEYNMTKKATIEGVKDIIKSSIFNRVLIMLMNRKFHEKLLEIASVRGYGVIKIVEYDEKGSVVLRVKNSYCAMGYKNLEYCVCNSMAGIIAGAAEVALNRNMKCVERKCVAKGDKYCEFELFEDKGLMDDLIIYKS